MALTFDNDLLIFTAQIESMQFLIFDHTDRKLQITVKIDTFCCKYIQSNCLKISSYVCV